jgi:hypothetical protein
MIDEQREKLIQRYLDGELDGSERQEFREQLKNDSELQQLLQEYSLLSQDLKSLDDARLPKSFWRERLKPAMQAELGVDTRSFIERLSELFNMRPESLRSAALGFVFVVLIIGTTVVLQNSFVKPGNEPYREAFARIESLRQEFLGELRVLSKEMDIRKEKLVPEVLAAYQQGLDEINKAIETAERYYAMNSDEQDAITRLMAAYDQKTNFLQQFLSLNIYENGE